MTWKWVVVGDQDTYFFQFLLPVVVENIEKSRTPYPSVEAVYILTPCVESCSRLVDDFARREGPMYAAAHVHFINGK
jgi:syntaxin-binding protein 1